MPNKKKEPSKWKTANNTTKQRKTSTTEREIQREGKNRLKQLFFIHIVQGVMGELVD